MEILPEGTRIKFLIEITQDANEETPAFFLAAKGDEGIIRKHYEGNEYSVYWDGWKPASFIAEFEKEFIIIN